MKDSRTESQKIIHNFVSVTVILMSAMLIALGTVTAKNNTMVIESGIQPAMIYASRENEQISVTVGQKLFEAKEKNVIKPVLLRFLPVPFGGAYIIYENILSLLK